MSNNIEALTDEQLNELIVWAGLSEFGDVVTSLEELKSLRQFRAELSLIGFVQAKAWHRIDNGESRFCAMYPVQHRLWRGRPHGCVAVYARREIGGQQ